jgi:transcriptional regulator with GAF, ATPase, and Fis domain
VDDISLATPMRERRWSPDRVTHLQPVGESIGSALAHRDVERALRSALEENARLRERLVAERAYPRAQLDEAHDFREIVGRSPALRVILEQVRQVAATDAPVLLLGETGTGKELLARTLRASGPRRDRPFVTVNCAALPMGLIESELFGYEKGAFTGATQAKPGRFALAGSGTLLLDEISDLDPALQVKLLRALEGGEIQRRLDMTRRSMSGYRGKPTCAGTCAKGGWIFSPERARSVRPGRRADISLLVWHFIQDASACSAGRSRRFRRPRWPRSWP